MKKLPMFEAMGEQTSMFSDHKSGVVPFQIKIRLEAAILEAVNKTRKFKVTNDVKKLCEEALSKQDAIATRHGIGNFGIDDPVLVTGNISCAYKIDVGYGDIHTVSLSMKVIPDDISYVGDKNMEFYATWDDDDGTIGITIRVGKYLNSSWTVRKPL